MAKRNLGEFITQTRGVSYKPSDVLRDGMGIPILRANNIQDSGLNYDDLVFVKSEKVGKEQELKDGDIVICASSGSKSLVGKAAIFYGYERAVSFGAFCKVIRVKESDEILSDYIRLYFQSKAYREQISNSSKGSNINNIKTEDIDNLWIKIIPYAEQIKAVDFATFVMRSIQVKKQEIAELDKLVKSKFIEMFGSLETNDKGWQVRGFNEFATIDGVMTTEYEKYADYPHIGIDSIEKGTGELKGWRTVKQDNVISGKYLFTPEHIIYSKIRPNLNKVALPDFDGLCSADAYPILVNKKNCNRYFLACVLRSEYFLSYILAFSARANMPKVNRQQIAGFSMPLPPLELQEEFAEFYKKTDKAKGVVRKQIADLQELLEKKMDEYFN